MKVITTERLPIKLWADDIDDATMEQFKALANLPFAVKHVAGMSDAHLGMGMPIGGVLATEEVIVPNAVGSDVACGVRAVYTNIKVDEFLPKAKEVMNKARQSIPVGFKKHKDFQEEFGVFEDCHSDYDLVDEINHIPVCFNNKSNASKSLGTLGGGNHFIEFQKDEEDYVWIMIHSGSRNLGYQVNKHYNKIAQDLNVKYCSSVPKELAFLPVGTEEGRNYINEMNYCVEYAKVNRQLMMSKVIEALYEVKYNFTAPLIADVAHNYARLENHYGKNVWVHRKGATSARKGEIGIIPGSQGTCSYIVEGLGNPESFMSCSHGAGRVLGRKQAKKTLSLENEQKALDEKGVIHSIRSTDDLDEAPGAYKDIDAVMNNQSDLVKIVKKLTPIAVIKG